jgi:hypothetical protein
MNRALVVKSGSSAVGVDLAWRICVWVVV